MLLLSFLSSSLLGQKVYWKSNYGKTNAPVGGMKNVKDIIKKEFVYPASCITNNIEGAIDIKYKLNKQGIPIISSISGTDNEAIKAETKRMFLKIRFSKSNLRTDNDPDDLFQITFSIKNWDKLSNKRKYQEINYPHLPIDSTEKVYKYQLLKIKPKPIYQKKESYSSFNNYISSKLTYPEEAFKIGLKGEVVISFIIEQSGQITNIEVLKPLPSGCTEEGLRLIKALKWYPAIVDGKAVRTLMTSSIGFGVASNAFQESFNQGR